ncbi:MAG: T9SS type A sorting domain-containing protein, partial [Flavobacteriales bacterium]
VAAQECYIFTLYDSYGDGMCCTNGVGQALITDANGNVIFEGDPTNLQNFTEIGEAFHTGSSTGATLDWECSPFGCVEGTPGLGDFFTQSQCESDPTTGCYVGPAWDCDPTQGCIDVGVGGTGTYNTEQECLDDASNPCGGSVGINDNTTEFALYPNPAQDVLSIDGVFKSIEIYNLVGKLVLASDNKSEINISSLANGSYYVNILTESAVIKKKVTVSK